MLKPIHKQRVDRFESRDYWTCCWRVASVSIRACVRAGGGHFEHMWCDMCDL